MSAQITVNQFIDGVILSSVLDEWEIVFSGPLSENENIMVFATPHGIRELSILFDGDVALFAELCHKGETLQYA